MNEWWRQATIYQVYTASFQDTTGNGKGDLNGITKKLDYIHDLGVDGIWMTPFFKSPMKDFGYDVSDYQAIDPSFGNFKDFDSLIAKAHSLQLKIIIDQVISHTSDQHEWFAESRKNRTNSKSDWYVWADPKKDGTPPNNWLSIFGGSAWQWDTRREQYYLHNFLAEQPDLNFHNPKVQKAVLSVLKFWLERGVDGLRLDTANFYFHDSKLRDNPPRKNNGVIFESKVNPYTYQEHLYDKTQLENLAFLKKLRKLMDQYGDTFTMGEVGANNSMQVISEYTQKGCLHTCYGFDFLQGELCPEYFQKVLKNSKKELKKTDGWIIWSFSNHDVERAVTRWLGKNKDNRNEQKSLAKLLLVLLVGLDGSTCIYQGEELGLPEADIPFEDLQDPYGIEMYPEFKGRDGCRTPMVWDNRFNNTGFSSGKKTWLPIPKEHQNLAVNLQKKDPSSVLNFFRHYLNFKKENINFFKGEVKTKTFKENGLQIIRVNEDTSTYTWFNLSNQKITLKANELLAEIKQRNTVKLEVNHLLKQTHFKNKVTLEKENITFSSYGVLQVFIKN